MMRAIEISGRGEFINFEGKYEGYPGKFICYLRIGIKYDNRGYRDVHNQTVFDLDGVTCVSSEIAHALHVYQLLVGLKVLEIVEENIKGMRKSFKDSLKALEADIQFANTLASDYPTEYDGGCLQMRLSYSPAAHFFLFLVQWTDCHLAGALGFLRILIYKAYENGKTTMSILERRASLREFYGVIFPSLMQLQRGITDVEDRKQREICSKFRKKFDMDKGKLSEIDMEREEECGICLEINTKVVLPKCTHSMCMKCYRSWLARSQSCPFCRDSLKRVNSGDLWLYTCKNEIDDLPSITRENLKRLFMYIDKLPLLVPSPMLVTQDPRSLQG